MGKLNVDGTEIQVLQIEEDEYHFNGADNFIKGAGYTYLLWTTANCYDYSA